ncbi:MAG: c-type cytochrome [Rhodospirillales bacterium]
MKPSVASLLLAGMLPGAFIGAFIGTLTPGPAHAGDAAKGKVVFNKCKACHDIRPGKNRVGPSLHGVFGRKAGTAPKYSYLGLKGADFVWDEPLLMEYLQDPKAFVKKRGQSRTKMIFKLPDKRQREDVIAYLKTLK